MTVGNAPGLGGPSLASFRTDLKSGQSVQVMTPLLSIYLDLLRLLAALGVVVSHGKLLMHGLPASVVENAGECVAVFFVLSGFVIRFVTAEKEVCARAYTIARLARIYPVAVLALVVTLAVDAIGWSINPEFYAQIRFINNGTGIVEGLRALSFTNETWFSHSVFGSNEPYWSLGFEIPFYLAFGIAIFGRGWFRVVGLAFWFAVFGPKVALYGVLWLLGLCTYDVIRHLGQRAIPLIAGAAIFGFGAIAVLAVRVGWDHEFFRIYRPDSMTDMIVGWSYYMAIGAALCITIVGAAVIGRHISRMPEWFDGPIKWLAGGSFTLYLIHLPIMVLILAVAPAADDKLAYGIAATLLACAATYALAELAERRKRGARTFFARLLDRT